MWKNKLEEILNLNSPINKIMTEIPNYFFEDFKGYTVKEVLEWIKDNHEESFPGNLIPFYGELNEDSYDGSMKALLVDPTSGEFFEIHGSHCSCFGFEGQLTPEICPIQYLEKGKQWESAYETVLEVVKYFASKEN